MNAKHIKNDEPKSYKLVYAKYDPVEGMIKERAITTRLVTPSFAAEYIERNNERAVMAYPPCADNCNGFLMMFIKSDGYRAEYNKAKDAWN